MKRKASFYLDGQKNAIDRLMPKGKGVDAKLMGKWRIDVRGLALSNSRSTMRLKAMAHVRAHTIANRIREKTRTPGQPRCSRAALLRRAGFADVHVERLTFRTLLAPVRPLLAAVARKAG